MRHGQVKERRGYQSNLTITVRQSFVLTVQQKTQCPLTWRALSIVHDARDTEQYEEITLLGSSVFTQTRSPGQQCVHADPLMSPPSGTLLHLVALPFLSLNSHSLPPSTD